MKRFLTADNLLRLFVALVLMFAVRDLMQTKPPWNTAWGKHQTADRDPSFREQVGAGLWFGSAARAGIAGVVLVLSLSWRKRKPEADEDATHDDFRLSESLSLQISGRVFAVGVVVIVASALVLRLPRMTHSFWGDEADAVATYIHGSFKPVDRDQPQGALTFHQPSWPETFFSAIHGPNNHALFSALSRVSLMVWRAMTHQPESSFSEWAARVPSLIGGLLSLVTLPLLMRRWGAPWLGLVAAAFMSLHPWHIRYSAEARGYGLTLALLPLLLHTLTNALRGNLWRQWLAFALVEFLTMYVWAGVAYAVAAVNVAAAIFILFRWPVLVRWLTANLLAAAAFISLYAPQVLQIARVKERSAWVKGGPMDEAWAHNVLVAPFTGIPFHQIDVTNPAEVSWQGLYAASPFLTTAGFTLIIALFITGVIVLWKWNRRIAALTTGVFIAAVVCCLHFKFVIKNELHPWYLVFTLPGLFVCMAVGAQTIAGLLPSRLRIAGAVALLAGAMLPLWPVDASIVRHPEEDFRAAAALCRDPSEVAAPPASSTVVTCWLWRYAALYDPRGEIHVRDAVALRQRMDEAKAAHHELHVVVGNRELAVELNADLLKLVDDAALFEKRAVFPARESLKTLEVFRMK